VFFPESTGRSLKTGNKLSKQGYAQTKYTNRHQQEFTPK